MADLSKIKAPDGTEVDIKDATARSGLADKMDKADPTGTGTLSINRRSSTTVGSYSVALGYNGTASGNYSTSLGNRTRATGAESVAQGYSSTASGSDSHAEGYSTTASGASAHSEGSGTTASGNQSHAEGDGCTAAGKYSHAEGDGSSTGSTADAAHAEGNATKANGKYSHAEGNNCTAAGQDSHAEGTGSSTGSDAVAAHAEGYNTTSAAFSAHAEGNSSSTSSAAFAAHAEGWGTTVSATAAHVEGYYTKASSDYQHVSGMCNIEDTNGTYAEIIGNGSNIDDRSNARTLDWNGNEWIAGGFKCNGMEASSSAVKLINPQKWRDAIFDATPEGSAKDRLLSRLYKEGANIRVLEYGGYFGGSQNKRLKITCPEASYGKFLIFVHLEADVTVHDYEIFGVLNAEGTAYSRAHYGRTTPSWTNMTGTAATGTLTWGVTGTRIYSSVFAPYGNWYVKIIMSIGADNDSIPNVYMTNES